MSTQRFDIQHAPAPRESFRLLYISKAGLAVTGTAPPTPIPARSCSTASAVKVSSTLPGSCFR